MSGFRGSGLSRALGCKVYGQCSGIRGVAG